MSFKVLISQKFPNANLLKLKIEFFVELDTTDNFRNKTKKLDKDLRDVNY